MLGSKVRDSVTGFEGVATAKHEYLNGCVRYSVEPPIGYDGKLPEAQTFDVQRLVVVEADVAVVSSASVGGARDVHDLDAMPSR